ncbi:MAG: MATE family efflux transporter [Pseudomonadota bacterium]
MDQPSGEFNVTNRMVLAIAVPMTLAFLTVPLLGLADTAIVGQFGDPAMIGGLAVGAIIFDLVFTTFNFLRTGTTGFVAQALGRGDVTGQQAIFFRAILMALVVGFILLPLSPLIRWFGLWIIGPDEAVYQAASTYMIIRFLGAPFTLINYSILGVLLGQDRAVANLIVQTAMNGLNIILSIILGLWLDWNIAGVAWGTVIAEAIIAIVAFLWLLNSFDKSQMPSRARILDRAALTKMVNVNRDIMIRSFALLTAFFLFTRMGSGLGTVTLAGNAILMNFFLLAAYFLDGLAAASEQLAGRAVGAGAVKAFWQTVRKTFGFGLTLTIIASILMLLFGNLAIDFMTTSAEVRQAAKQYLFWAALTPIAGVLAFQMDGVFIGATWSVDMRNVMLLSLFVFIALGYLLTPIWGNHGLWFALNAWLVLRGLGLLYVLPKRAGEIAIN